MDDDRRSVQQHVALVVAAAALSLAGCVATVQTYPPSPPPVAYQTPTPAYDAQAYDEASGGEIQASEPPPPLPDYDQPPCPEDGYIWTPGYWSSSQGGYYWVPGTWVAPPQVGLLWTPGYWGVAGPAYVFHPGYWGPRVGFYGGVHYGYGYTGEGYAGGHWEGGRFAYNRSVTNVNVTVVHNVYNQTVINNVSVNKVSYNGGPGGVRAEATPEQRQWAREQHVNATPLQARHAQEASSNPAMFSKVNGGRPAIAATPRPAAFAEPGAVGAQGAAMPPPIAPSTQQRTFAPGQPAGTPHGWQPNAGHPTTATAGQPRLNTTYQAPRPPAPTSTVKPPPVPTSKAPPPHSKENRQDDHRQ